MIKIHYVYIILLRSIQFPDKCLRFRLESVDEFTNITLITFRPSFGHHRWLLTCVKSVYLKSFFKGVLVFFYNIIYDVNQCF